MAEGEGEGGRRWEREKVRKGEGGWVGGGGGSREKVGEGEGEGGRRWG